MSRTFPRPLPRTLVPLAGESLPGYILRLSYRLDMTPGQLCCWTGLGGRSDSGWTAQPPAGPMVRMTPQQVEMFATACNLSRSEVRSLTMAALARRYPPVASAPVSAGHSHRSARAIVAADPWVTPRLTRYCPACLAGDGSPIQNRFGGAWQSRWRLAVVFACTQHQRLLEWQCPGCETPAQAMDPIYQTSLVSQVSAPPVHPATCRFGWWRRGAFCGTRLDEVGPPPMADDPVTEHLLALQARLDRILDGHEPRPRSLGRQVSAATYFADLRVMARLVQAAFPNSMAGAAVRRLDPYITWHLADGRAAERDYLAPLVRGHYAESDVPPFRSDALGCLMLLAAEFLNAPSPEAVAQRIKRVLSRSLFDRTHGRRLANVPRLSEGMKRVIVAGLDAMPTPVWERSRRSRRQQNGAA